MLPVSSLPEYGDFDDEDVYKRCYNAAERGDTRNFVIEFDSTNAYAAHDLGEASIEQLLQLEVNDFAHHIHEIGEDVGCMNCYPEFEG